IEPEPLVEKIVEWSKIARKDGLLGLEEVSEKEEMEFLKKGLQLLIDGNEPEEVRQILEIDMDAYENFHTLGAKVYEGLGIYAPTLGIIGAVMGLMAVMQNLADPSKLGTGIAAAFVATIYGIGFANLVFLPMASKLKYIIGEQVKLYQLIVDGLVMIAEGENPRNIEMKLSSYFI
ncbi:MAG: flagellar motor protein, partial [Sinobacterium sp.]|nr:flagellar motor protein [Sinobacterium sp.]